MSRRLADAARQWDRRMFRAVATFDAPALDAALPRLSRAADHGLLWLAIAGAVAVSGPEGRRAATRGMASLGVASALVNGPAKWMFRRQRPTLDLVPPVRLLSRQPGTTSFPSGHSASAAAFAAGLALERPGWAVPVALLATGVAYSRVHTGVHYPADVLVGAGLGVGAAFAVRSTWPVRPTRAGAATADPVEAPALPDGRGLVVVVNDDARAADGPALSAAITKLLPAAEVVVCDDASRLPAALDEAAGRAEVLGVAGGDGTVNRAAAVALRHGLPLAVLPAGTLDHFARDLGVDDVEQVAAAVRDGQAVEVTVGSASRDGDDLYFLNTFSIGLYPELVRRRERRQRWLGKWPALALALAEVLGSAESVDVVVDGTPRKLWLLFGGNGRYHPDGFAPSWRERLDEDRVDVRLVNAASPLARTRLVAAVLSGRLGRCRVYEETLVESLTLRLPDGGWRLARDGEVNDAPEEIVLRPATRRLVVYRPADV